MPPSFSKAALLPLSLILTLTTASPIDHTRRASAMVPPTTTTTPSSQSITPSAPSIPILAQREELEFTTLLTTISVSGSTPTASTSSFPLLSADAHPTSLHLNPTTPLATTQTASLAPLQKRGKPKHTSTPSPSPPPPPSTTPPPSPPPSATQAPAPTTTTPKDPAATDGPLFTIPDPTPTTTPSPAPNADVKGGIEIIPLGTNTIKKREETKATATATSSAGVEGGEVGVNKGAGGTKALVAGGNMVPKGGPHVQEF